MSLFRLDASIRRDGSTSRTIADIVERSWRDEHPEPVVHERHIGLEPLPSDAWALALTARELAEGERSAAQLAATRLAGTLVDELLDAEALLFAIPLYNFGVSQHVKAWVDLVITDPRMGEGQPLAGKPAVLVIVRGGAYGPGTPREGWDHATSWYRRVFEDVWGLDLKVVESEFSLVGVNPALDQFKELAAQMRHDAERLAAEHGRRLAGALTH